MTALTLDVPSRGGRAFSWLLERMRAGESAFANELMSFRTGEGFGLSIGDKPLATMQLAAPSDEIEVAPGRLVRPIEEDRLVEFLNNEWLAFDHLGINLSQTDLDETQWHRLIAALAPKLPAWRLEIGSANDIVMIVAEERDRISVVELVHDRVAPRSSFHVCARVTADRAKVEAVFPAPFGTYKPGDEAFFRSVALPVSSRLPSYFDLAFSDARMGPWPQIMAAMGKRIAS